MSNELTNSMRRLQVTPSQKAVLMSLCDGAADGGEVPEWRSSLTALAEWTCLGRTAVIDALKGLQAAGIIKIDRSFGRVSRIKVLHASAQTNHHPSASRTGTDSEPVRQTNHHPSASRTTPVRQTDGTRPANGPFTPIHQTPEEHLNGAATSNHPPGKRRSKPETPLAVDFRPDETGMGYAAERGLQFEQELQSFKNHHLAKGTKFRDWQAGWRTWCDKAMKFGGSGKGQMPQMTFAEQDELNSIIRMSEFTNKPVNLDRLTPAQRAEIQRRQSSGRQPGARRAGFVIDTYEVSDVIPA